MSPSRPCLRCGRPSPSTRCWTCQRTHEATRRPPAQVRYPAEYRRNRRLILAGSPPCALCGQAPATTVDHVIPVSRGGGHGIDNLRPACAPCNYRRGNRP